MTGIIKDGLITVINPITDQIVSTVKCSDLETVNRAIHHAKLYKDWSSLSLKERCGHIKQFRKIIVEHKDDIAKVLQDETGKKDFDILIEMFGLFEHLKHITKIAKKALKPSPRNAGIMKNKKAYVLYEPLGVAGIISPWNYPLTTPISAVVEALLAGNTVVLKPSEHTPLTALYVKKLWDDYIGFNHAFNIVSGGGEVGQMLVNSKHIDIICFTGSTHTGKLIAIECAKTLKPVILELGGKDPMVVLNDANLKRSVESALFGGYSNAGQTCISVEEVFVEDIIFDRFVAMMSEKVKNMSSGFEDSMEIGSMIMQQNCSKVKEHINEITDKGKIVSGQSSNHNMYIAPTLIINPPEYSKVVNEETFGPVISIRSFSNQDDLINKVHKTGYGLAGSIFGRNKKRMRRLLKEMKIGNVSINDVLTHYGIASLPFGGERLSGLGRLHGKEGLRSLCRIKSVVENRFSFIGDPWWFGRPKFIERFLNFFLKFYYKL